VGVGPVGRGSGVWTSADGVGEVVGPVRMESEGSGSGVDDWGGFVRMGLWGEGGSQLGGESGEQVVGMDTGSVTFESQSCAREVSSVKNKQKE